MDCPELTRLRQQAQALRRQLNAQRQKASEWAEEDRAGHRGGLSDYEAVYKRRLENVAVEIERHIAQHKCQD